jgi:hypothetical protein
VEPGVCLEILEKRKVSYPYLVLNPGTPSTLPSWYADYASLSPVCGINLDSRMLG